MHTSIIVIIGILASLTHQFVKRKDGSNLEYVLGTTLISSGFLAGAGTLTTLVNSTATPDYVFATVAAFAFYGIFGESDVVQGLKARLIDITFAALGKIASRPQGGPST